MEFELIKRRPSIAIERVGASLPADFAALADEASAEGHKHLSRLVDEWREGSNRFSRAGEGLLIARRARELVAVGGMNWDPYVPQALRMRRFYVRPEARGQGIGRMIAELLIAGAVRYTTLVTVNAGLPGAAGFWEQIEFVPVEAERHTHELTIG